MKTSVDLKAAEESNDGSVMIRKVKSGSKKHKKTKKEKDALDAGLKVEPAEDIFSKDPDQNGGGGDGEGSSTSAGKDESHPRNRSGH